MSVGMPHRSPGPHTREYSPFALERVFKGAYDDTTCLRWSSCSRILAVGSRDSNTRLYAFERLENLSTYSIGGHAEPVIGVFFEKDSLCAYTVSRNGHLAVWESSLEPQDLKTLVREKAKGKKKRKKQKSDGDESEDEVPNEEEDRGEGNVETVDAAGGDQQTKEEGKLFYKRRARHFLKDILPEGDRRADLTAADYHQSTKILVTGFSNGAFFIHEMPDCSLIHSLSISDQG